MVVVAVRVQATQYECWCVLTGRRGDFRSLMLPNRSHQFPTIRSHRTLACCAPGFGIYTTFRTIQSHASCKKKCNRGLRSIIICSHNQSRMPYILYGAVFSERRGTIYQMASPSTYLVTLKLTKGAPYYPHGVRKGDFINTTYYRLWNSIS